jgi:hypothetical protein
MPRVSQVCEPTKGKQTNQMRDRQEDVGYLLGCLGTRGLAAWGRKYGQPLIQWSAIQPAECAHRRWTLS